MTERFEQIDWAVFWTERGRQCRRIGFMTEAEARDCAATINYMTHPNHQRTDVTVEPVFRRIKT
jgi:hypothetical protein